MLQSLCEGLAKPKSYFIDLHTGDPIGLPTRPGRSRASGPLGANFNRLSMSPSDPNGPQRNSQPVDHVLQIGETVRSNIRFESRCGRQILNDFADALGRSRRDTLVSARRG